MSKKTKTRLYQIWCHMRRRCLKSTEKAFKNYGGRGITVCAEWVNDFEVFKEWALANGYQETLTIDRKNNNGNYEPSNCRWITRQKQCNNTRYNVNITISGDTKTLKEWSVHFGINYSTVKARYRRGWSTSDIFSALRYDKKES